MATTNVTLSARKMIADNVVLRVRLKGYGLAMFRLRCAVLIAWVAAKVAGTGFEVGTE